VSNYNINVSNRLQPQFDGVAPFADPFTDLASVAMPLSVPAMLRHAEFFANADATLRGAYERVAAYFLTDITVDGELGEDERKKQKEYLIDRAGVIPFLFEHSLNLLVYGNAYLTVSLAFTRYIKCRRCAVQYRLTEFQKNPRCEYRWSSGIHGKCHACGYSGVFADKDHDPIDVPDDSKPIILKSWNPHDIQVQYNESSGETIAYRWIIPAEFRSDIRLGRSPGVIASTPWEHVQAVLNNENVEYDPELMHHWREPALSGLRFRGVGVPRAIINYRKLYYNRVIERMNEVLALGHIVPMRVISPMNTSGRDGDGDILKTGYMGDVRSRIMRMVANHRADPSGIEVSPIPLQMSSLGADARQLIPAELMQESQKQILNAVGAPIDFYAMTMGMQTAPVGLRLFERVWAPFVYGQNRCLEFIARRSQFLLKWENSTIKLLSVRIIDSIENNQLRVQMAQAGLLSRTTATRAVDADFETEVKQKLEDQRIENVLGAEFQRKMDAFAFSSQLAEAGGMPPGMGGPQGQAGAPPQGGQGGQGGQPQQGGPPQPGGQAQPGQPQAAGTPAGQDPLAGIMPQEGQSMDPREWVGRAEQAAQYLIQLPESQRFGELKRLREGNKYFHGLVKQKLESMRSEARSKGKNLFMQQAYGAQD
jgi:hypothetical protein